MPSEVVDHTLPGARWEFDEGVTAVFDNMLARSIPQYEVMRRACFDLGCAYVQPHTDIVDLGCSRGEAMAPFVERFGAGNRYLGVEISKPMADAARARFKGYLDCSVVRISGQDLRERYPAAKASLTLAVLTVQFVPIEHRQRLIRDIYKTTVPGGALIFVEKILGATAELDRLMVERYYDMKRANGYSEDEIQRKRLSLEGVLVPVTAHWNEELLRMAGFSQIDCFWRWMNFAGWIAVRDA